MMNDKSANGVRLLLSIANMAFTLIGHIDELPAWRRDLIYKLAGFLIGDDLKHLRGLKDQWERLP